MAADGAAYLDELAKHADEPFAITGYCMGARLGLRIAAAHPDRVAALGGFHGGGLVTDDPQSPHLSAGALRAELYLGHADNDGSNSPEQIAALDAALDEAGVTHTHRGLRGRGPRLHDVGHARLQRAGGRAPLQPPLFDAARSLRL